MCNIEKNRILKPFTNMSNFKTITWIIMWHLEFVFLKNHHMGHHTHDISNLFFRNQLD